MHFLKGIVYDERKHLAGGKENVKKFWKKGFVVGLAAVVASAAYMMGSAQHLESFAAEQSRQQELTVRFDMEYPEVEKELNPQVEGLNDGEECGFIWKVDDKIEIRYSCCWWWTCWM